MRKGNERKSPSLDFDVGLGLKMQQATDSYYSDGGGRNLYGVSDALFAHRGFHHPVSKGGKALFTASQWQELERQKMIHNYILASIPVPPQLLLPTSRSSSSSSLSQSNSLDLRFSSGGTDPEPWRCKRTDGKKWRCSRDVAPDLKYCERHAHKSRPRSRKLVEISSHKPPTTLPLHTSSLSPATSYDQTRVWQYWACGSSVAVFLHINVGMMIFLCFFFIYGRCIEWFMKGGSGTNSVSTNKQEQQWEQVMQLSSSRMEPNKDNTDHNKNVAFHSSQQGDFMSLNPYIPDTSNLRHNDQHPIFDPKIKSLTQTTRHFIDAWEKEGFEGMRSKGLSASLSIKFPISSSSSSLSLSMCGGDYDSSKGDLGIGTVSSERVNEGVLKPQWMNSVSWMNSPPGGPLGEALCLGNATTTRGSLGISNLGSPNGYGYCNTNTNANSSICSKSSCEDGSFALNFIGDS